jgi:hypothetical protein
MRQLFQKSHLKRFPTALLKAAFHSLKNCARDPEAYYLGSGEVNGQHQLLGYLGRNLSRFCSLQYLVHELGGLSPNPPEVSPVGD